MVATITGDKELDKNLRRLGGKSANKVSAAAIRAGMRIIQKGIKSEIPSHMKESRKSIGSRFKRNTRKGDGIVMAKVGAAVGMKKTKQEAAAERAKATHSQGKGARGKRPGVGISANNIFWLLMGTKERFHDPVVTATGKKLGASTGVMPKLGAVRRGYAKTKDAATKKIIENLRKGIAREAAKK